MKTRTYLSYPSKSIKKANTIHWISKAFFTAISLLLFSFLSISANAQCTGTNIIQDPTEFEWKFHPESPTNPEPYYSGVLEVGEVTLNLNNGETFKTRAYRQKGGSYSVPGPTFKMSPGNKYILRLHNLLPYTEKEQAHNVFKDPDIVNIHTHGLHISGESPGDDVTRAFEGGRGGDFVWDIPADHMGGTYWYHAHHHGSTYLQVSGGMFGMIVIDDTNDNIPSSVAAMEERLLQFGLLDPSAAGTGGDTLMGGSLSSNTWTTNGVVNGTLCMPPNTWQHFRVSIADRGSMLREFGFGPECEVKLLSRDGVWRTVAPKDLSLNALLLTGASRADFAVRTSANSTITMGGTVIANINVNGPADGSAHPFDVDGVSQWSASRPSYLRDLRNETNINFESVSMGARTVNGSKFDHMNPTFELEPTHVQEWSLSGNVRHPFHLHIYHVQALSDDRDFEAGEYYDVVASSTDIRFDLNDATSSPYFGRTIMHCHVLQHEDQGAMGWLKVINGGTAAPTFPANSDIVIPYSDYYVLEADPPGNPTGLGAIAVSSAIIDLAWTDNSTDEDGFNVERSTDGINFIFVGTTGANTTSYSDPGLEATTEYYYRVSAFNAAGTSSPTNIANATTLTPPQPPAAPSGLSAISISSSAIDLSWNDQSVNEDNFNIERSADGINFSTLITLGPDITSYSDNGLTASTIYYYRINASNGGGTSDFSNVASATTDPSSERIINVENIVVTRNPINGNRFEGEATVSIFDNTSSPVSGAAVSVSWTGPNSGTSDGITNGSGEVTFATNGKKNPSGEWCFTITDVSLAGAVYNAEANVITVACESGPQSLKANKGESDESLRTNSFNIQEKVKEEFSDKVNEEAVMNHGARFLAVFPNPAQNHAQILFELPETTRASIEIYSLVGDLIAIIADKQFNAGQNLIYLETEQMHGGSYIIMLRVKQKIETKRLTIIR